MSDASSRIVSIFNEAIALPSEQERKNWVSVACSGDSTLQGRVEALLAAHDRAGQFLAGGSGNGAAMEQERNSTDGPQGTQIGPYLIVRQVGEGGMGVVYLADQLAPVKRRVAVKLIKPGMDTRQVIARFEAERQALALMDHPHIARVFDAGSSSTGAPYFVMEWVRGVPMNEFCDRNQLGISERLALFMEVCHAVQHAHQKGIIHRDIKPSNVLVELRDGKGVPKVIDFGVAKAMNQSLTDKTLNTHALQLVGTPLYMSPEQASGGLDIDTRSDIYSLGVLLYELLVGTTPVPKGQLHSAGPDEIRRIIRDDPVPRPSARVGKLGRDDADIAAQRRTTTERLRSICRGDLDSIVMKALEKDRERRYATAERLARDVQRHLSNLPIEARPPSALDQVRKFSRRHRMAIGSAALLLVVLLVGALVSTWQAIRATSAERLADAKRIEAEANYQRARAAVDRYFTLVSENSLVNVPGLQPLRKDLLQAALSFYGDFADDRSGDPGTLADLAVTQLRLAAIYQSLNEPGEFLSTIERAVRSIERLQREFPSSHAEHSRLAGFWKGSRNTTAHMIPSQDPQAVHQLLVRLSEAWTVFAAQNPDVVGFRSDLAALNLQIDGLLGTINRHEEALKFVANAQEILMTLTDQFPDVGEYRADLAWTYEAFVANLNSLGRPDETEPYFRKSLAVREQLFRDDPENLQYRAFLVASLAQLGVRVMDRDPAEAEIAFRRAIDLVEPLWSTYPGTLLYQQRLSYSLNNLGKLLSKAGRESEAESVRNRLIDFNQAWLQLQPNDWTYRAVVGHSHRKNAFYQMNTHREREAEWSLRKALDAFVRLVADHHEETAHRHFLSDTHSWLAELLLRQGRAAAAIEESEKAVSADPHDPRAHKLLLDGLAAAGDNDRTLQTLSGNTQKYPDSAASHLYLGVALAQQGKNSEALAEYERALAVKPDWELARTMVQKARAKTSGR